MLMIELYIKFEQHMRLNAVDEEINIDELRITTVKRNSKPTTKSMKMITETWQGIRQCKMKQLHFGSHVLGEGNVVAEDDEFSVGMEFGSRESVISAIKSYNIQTFYAKYKGYGAGCDWLIRELA
ncbi:hypothetical protein Ahy_A07g033082 [Arachis hypogaea]|uniref:Transposase MuDR plant domain-containing protein n=1 Tax=Arachis hypogaea TaxID=3818 RepID=A0A445C861_ARAHY|nr:hypothetical protein Ahy_A07g033082 [Arachis hypogaea]